VIGEVPTVADLLDRIETDAAGVLDRLQQGLRG
jgi:hypothetical protein